MREVVCAETGHSVYLDEATGKIDSFRFSNQAGAQRVANAIQRVLDMHGDPPVNDLVLLQLRGVEVDIVASAFAEWTNDRTTRWRIDDSGRLVPTGWRDLPVQGRTGRDCFSPVSPFRGVDLLAS